MFFLRARPEPEWRGARGVSEVTVRAEVLFEGEREFQAIRQDIADSSSPPPALSTPPEAPEHQKKIRKRLNIFRRRKDATPSADSQVTPAESATERLSNIKLQSSLSDSRNPTTPAEAKGPCRGLLFRRKGRADTPVMRTSQSYDTSNDAHFECDDSLSKSPGGTREPSEETYSSKDRSTSYSGFGSKRAKGFFSRNKSNNKSIEEEDRTATPLKNGLKSLMKVTQENPEDSPLHGSPVVYGGTSLSESFSWRDNSTRISDASQWNLSGIESPSKASSAASTQDAPWRDATLTCPGSAQSALHRRRGLFSFGRDKSVSLCKARKAEQKRFVNKTTKSPACSDREATEQLNQMISLVASADDDDEEEDIGSRFSWVECQGAWPPTGASPLRPASSHGVYNATILDTAGSARATVYVDGDGVPSPGSHLSVWSSASQAHHGSPDASFDSLRTTSPDGLQQLSTGTDQWVADFSVFDSPPYNGSNAHDHQPHSAVELRAHLATAERLLNTSKDSVESITSRDNMSPLSWTPHATRQYNSRGVAIRHLAASTKSKSDARMENSDLSARAKEAERRTRQRPRSWFRGAKGEVDVFREAQTLLDILHETFPEGEMDSPGSDLRTVY
ncbi:hypothetical protein BIW11_05628 [Tropilaelaps mercedesae]|uniref:Uncharacterized protein n=1 Tax=Tropilaelaps mercedesae TaxID=418985 RepID=A0A1V9Y1L5_9ACAR|nr:hypothetical protein BIW11_05628 [Tropilaelaps mercedesae]